MDEEVLEVIEQLMAWHGNRVDQLNEILNHDETKIKIGEDLEITDPKVLKGVRIGVQISLSLLGKLPISLNKEGES